MGTFIQTLNEDLLHCLTSFNLMLFSRCCSRGKLTFIRPLLLALLTDCVFTVKFAAFEGANSALKAQTFILQHHVIILTHPQITDFISKNWDQQIPQQLDHSQKGYMKQLSWWLNSRAENISSSKVKEQFLHPLNLKVFLCCISPPLAGQISHCITALKKAFKWRF